MIRVLVFSLTFAFAALGCKKEDAAEQKQSEAKEPQQSPSPPKQEEKKDKPKEKVEPKAPEAKKEAKAEEKFIGVNEWVRIGDVRVKATKAKIQKVPLSTESGATILTDEPRLMIWFEIENLSETKKVRYVRWNAGAHVGTAEIRDEHGNKYSASDFDNVQGAPKFGTKEMRPGDPPLADAMCVELPIEKATKLKLKLFTLQPEQEEKWGYYRFEIPASAWKEERK